MWQIQHSALRTAVYLDQAETLSQDEWVTVTGTYHYDEEKGMEIQVLKVEKAEAAEDEYVYPVY